MRVLMTGDMGFVGSATKRHLAENHPEIEIIGYDLMNAFDIRDEHQLEGIVSETEPDRILHLAAIARFADADRDPMLAFETNVGGTRNVVNVAEKHHIPLVYASTGSVYMPISRNPPITEDFECKGNSVYGCVKYMGELFVRQHTPHIILRYAHLYGQEKRMHGLIGGFTERIERGLAPVLYGGKQSNDFTYIKDVAEANYLALAASWDKWNQAYNIGTGEELSSEEAGRLICELSGYHGKVEIRDARTVDPQRFVYSIEKARRMLNFSPRYYFRDGLTDMFGMKAEETRENGIKDEGT
jgi:nucleoside-diphosphate-sugar epimerase